MIQRPFFQFHVEDVFFISGGVVATGTVVRGAVRINDTLYLKKNNGERKPVKILGIESYRKILKEALMGESIGLTISDVSKDEVQVGDTISFDS